jgi:ribonuclease VapC
MIAVDTSVLMAILLDEPEADACIAALEAEDGLLICAGTVAEALIVSARRNVGACRLLYVGNDFAKTDVESVL